MIIEGFAKAINESGISRYRISIDTGIDKAVLSRIVHGGCCSVGTLEVLCEYLNLEVVVISAGKRKVKK